ncbi:MAG: metallophosphoesterase family protein [Akkermansiaceae bacterium]
MRTLAIGDIHGCLTAFKTLVDFVSPSADDTLVTLGDYIDRGPDSKGVIDYLIELREQYQVVTLKGNHELMIENALLDTEALYFWLINGGDTAAYSFDIDRLEDIPEKYWSFIRACELFYETDQHILVHAGLDPDIALDQQTTEDLCWRRILDTEPHYSGKTLVCGHTPQRNGIPLVLDHAICIDTHVFGDQWLTCLDIDNGQYWQANQSGETREGTLTKD